MVDVKQKCSEYLDCMNCDWLYDCDNNYSDKQLLECTFNKLKQDFYKQTEMSLIVEQMCMGYRDCNIDYYKNEGEFHYDMHEKYDNEILIKFKLNSPEVLKFMEELDGIKCKDFYFTENFGEESGCEFDRIWVWW